MLACAVAWFIGRVLDRVPLAIMLATCWSRSMGQVRGELRPIAFQRVKAMEPAHPA